MKNLFKSILAIAAIAAIAPSCSKQEADIPSTSEKKSISFSAVNEAVVADESKAFINWADLTQTWEAEDAISVFDGSANNRLSNTLSDGAEAKFCGEVGQASSYAALYPYQEGASYAEGKISATLPSVQTAIVSGVDRSALLAVASSSDKALSFKNVFGIVRFDITETDVTTVIIEGNNGEILAGEVAITPGDTPTWEAVKGESAIVLNSPDGTAFTEGSYAVAVLPQTFEKGFKLILRKDGSVKCGIKNLKTSTSVARSGGVSVAADLFTNLAYNYYYILTKADLDGFFDDCANWADTDVAYLGADIDYGKAVRGHKSGVFKGLFDGRYHRIYNIYGNGENCKAGFFSQTLGATVKNLCLGSADYDWSKGSAADAGTYDGYSHYKITGCGADYTNGNQWYYCGSIAAYINTGTVIENCVNFCEVRMVPTSFKSCTPTKSYGYGFRAGGIVGTMKGSTTVKNCVNYGKVYNNDRVPNHFAGTSLQLGGITSVVDGTDSKLYDCVNRGDVTNNNKRIYFTAGIIGGLNYPITISNCHNYGTITDASAAKDGTLYIGGIAGTSYKDGSKITGCSNSGKIVVSGAAVRTVCVGGILAYNSTVTTPITDCHNLEGSEINISGATYESTGTIYNAVGGILGMGQKGDTSAPINMQNCSNNGRIVVTQTQNVGKIDWRIGGLLGSAVYGGKISNCTNAGSIDVCGNYNYLVRIGGIAASSTNNGLNIENCHTAECTLNCTSPEGTTLADLQIGGINGYNGTAPFTFDGCTSKATLTQSGAISTPKLNGIMGVTTSGGAYHIKNCKIAGHINGVEITAENFSDYIYSYTNKAATTLEGCSFLSE